MKNRLWIGNYRKQYLKMVLFLIGVLAYLLGCASLLNFPTYFDPTTYKNLTDLKPEILLLYDSFSKDSLNFEQFDSIRLKLSQMIEYEKGKGPKNAETAKQMDLIKTMYERHIADRVNSPTPWNQTHLDNCKENIGEAFDIAISTEALKNKN